MLVLASNSPRRRQLISLGGWEYTLIPTKIDESTIPGECAEDYVRRLAEMKAHAACRMISPEHLPGSLVIGADTAVVSEGEVMGKPTDAEDARRMLHHLRGRLHQVFTAVTVLNPATDELSRAVCVTDVPMRDYSDEEVQDYIASGDPFDKAGAYAIQHPVFKPVRDLHGCYANVMGMPLCHLTRLLARYAIHPQVEIAQACQATIGYSCPVFQRILIGEME